MPKFCFGEVIDGRMTFRFALNESMQRDMDEKALADGSHWRPWRDVQRSPEVDAIMNHITDGRWGQ
jgi:hypothetical protein